MTTEEFNALPLEARRFISDKKGCSSCGGGANLDQLYKKYLEMQKTTFYTLKNGALPSEMGVLYPIEPTDSDAVLVEKLKLSVKIFAKRPDKFTIFDNDRINSFLNPKKVKTNKQNETISSEEID